MKGSIIWRSGKSKKSGGIGTHITAITKRRFLPNLQRVKALRAGKGQISDAFARVENDEVLLYNAHIDEYAHGNLQNHEPKAVRKLLLHKSEIRKLFGLAAIKGNALFPLAFYWKNGKVKVSLAVGKGKAQFDKREDLKTREAERELKRATMRKLKS